MKRRIQVFCLVLACAVSAIAQTRRTVAEARADHNAKVCEAAKQHKGCTQAQVTEAKVEGTIYATDAAFRDGELLPEILAKRTEERTTRAAEALYRWFLTASPADRVQACFRLPDPEVCR